MGLTVHYDWKVKGDARVACRLIRRMHAAAKRLPFEDVSEIMEEQPPQGRATFEVVDGGYSPASICLARQRADGRTELVTVPATHAVFFCVNNDGAETATIGLAAHRPVIVHREDVVEFDDEGREVGRRLNAGPAVEFPTRRRGYYSWHSGCKTQYAGSPRRGGEPNFLRVHLSLIDLFDRIREIGPTVRVRDDSGYARHRNPDRLLRSLREWDATVAGFVGNLSDALARHGLAASAPIKDRPDSST